MNVRRCIGGLLASVLDDGLFVVRRAGVALVKERADLALKLALGPVALEIFIFVEDMRGIIPRRLDKNCPTLQ